MPGFNLPFKFPFTKAQNTTGIDPSVQSRQPVKLQNSAPTQTKKKSLAELEKEAEAKYYATYPHKQPQPVKAAKAKQGILSKIIWSAIRCSVNRGNQPVNNAANQFHKRKG